MVIMVTMVIMMIMLMMNMIVIVVRMILMLVMMMLVLMVKGGKLSQVLIGIRMKLIIELHIQLVDTHLPEDHLCVTDHIFSVGVPAHFQFETTAKRVSTKRPKVWLLNPLYSSKLLYFVIAFW